MVFATPAGVFSLFYTVLKVIWWLHIYTLMVKLHFFVSSWPSLYVSVSSAAVPALVCPVWDVECVFDGLTLWCVCDSEWAQGSWTAALYVNMAGGRDEESPSLSTLSPARLSRRGFEHGHCEEKQTTSRSVRFRDECRISVSRCFRLD